MFSVYMYLTLFTGSFMANRSVANVCGGWDLDLIQFELDRVSTLQDLVQSVSTHT